MLTDTKLPVARTANLGWAGSLLSEANEQGGTILRHGFSSALDEMGLQGIQSFLNTQRSEFQLPRGTKAAVKVAEKSYMPGDRYIRSDDVRKACDIAFRNAKKEVVWIESAGTFDMGNGGEREMDLGNDYTTASVSAKVSTGLRYRRLEPYETASGAVDSGVSLWHSLELPLRASAAQMLPAGAEFELIGEGKARFAPALGSLLNWNAYSASVNVNANFGIELEGMGEMSLMVQKLLEPNLVMVRLSCSKGSSRSLQGQVTADAQMPTKGLLDYFPRWVVSIARYILDTAGFRALERFASYLKSAIKATLTAKKSRKGLERFVFDLSKPECALAYDQIFRQLSTKDATRLSKIPGSGVKAQGSDEYENSSTTKGIAHCADTEILSYLSASECRVGQITREQKRQIAYRESKYSRATSNWFSGVKSILWESVSVEENSYYHLNFHKRQMVHDDRAVDDFLSFCSALGISADNRSISGFARALCAREEMDSDVDIYFTDEGVQRLNACTFEEAVRAHLDIQAKFNLGLKGMKTNPNGPSYRVAQRYNALSSRWPLIRWFHHKALASLEGIYKKVWGRDIQVDANAIREATQFAKRMAAMDDKSSHKSVKDFFAYLGRNTGFDFMKTIAAMAQIAGQDQTLIHQASISGGGLSIAAVDEGEVMHPEREAMRALVKLT